jgi:hypothetical protein
MDRGAPDIRMVRRCGQAGNPNIAHDRQWKNLVGGPPPDAEQRCYFLETAVFYPRPATRAARLRRRAPYCP